MVEQKGIKNICFCGHVDNCEIYSYLNKADIFISSPVIDNQPMSVLEAFNAGLLVISSNVGGVPYMIEMVGQDYYLKVIILLSYREKCFGQ